VEQSREQATFPPIFLVHRLLSTSIQFTPKSQLTIALSYSTAAMMMEPLDEQATSTKLRVPDEDRIVNVAP
jgi:hypothetical protein